MKVIDYTRVEYGDARSVEPRSRSGFFGVGLDDSGQIIGGRTESDRNLPGQHRFVGPVLDAATLSRFAEGDAPSHRSDLLRVDEHAQLRGDQVHRALGQLRQPLSGLGRGDAVVLREAGQGRTWRHDEPVLAVESGRLCVAGAWFDTDGSSLDESQEISIESATTMTGEQPAEHVHGDINAQLYLLRDRVEQWNPHNPQLSEKIAGWTQRLDLLDETTERVAGEHSTGPTRLLNEVSDLQLISSRLDQDMERIGAKTPHHSPGAEHAARISRIQSRAADFERPDDQGYQPGT